MSSFLGIDSMTGGPLEEYPVTLKTGRFKI
jgi:hypothetical protein